MDFHRRLTINLLIILISFLLFGGLFYWLSGALASQAEKIAAINSSDMEQKQLVSNLATFKAIGSQIGAYQTAMDALLPSKDGLVLLPNSLDALARADKVTMNFSFQGNAVPSSSNSAGYISFTMGVSGAYSNIENFLSDIETKSTNFLLSVDTFDLSRSGGAFSISIQGRTFFK